MHAPTEVKVHAPATNVEGHVPVMEVKVHTPMTEVKGRNKGRGAPSNNKFNQISTWECVWGGGGGEGRSFFPKSLSFPYCHHHHQFFLHGYNLYSTWHSQHHLKHYI